MDTLATLACVLVAALAFSWGMIALIRMVVLDGYRAVPHRDCGDFDVTARW